MRRMIKPVYLISAVLGITTGVILSYVTWQRRLDRMVPHKPNILVLSLCSLRKDVLNFYDPKAPSVTPNISRAFAESFVLDNVFSSFGWTNLSLYFLKQFDGNFLQRHGYDIIEDDWRPASVHVPGRLDAQTYEGPPEQFVNFTQPKLDFVKQRVLSYRKRPFFAYIHIKYMHFPYMDRLNTDAGWDRFLSREERARAERVLAQPGSAKDWLPFAMTLTGDPRLLDSVPEFKTSEVDPFKAFFGMYNLLIDRGFLAAWKNQPGYLSDLALLKKVYRAKLAKLDEMLGEILDLYGSADLNDETILVLMGDHGEAFMEHGALGHGNNVFDEVLTLPVLVRYPRSRLGGVKHITEQIYMGSLADWLREIITQGHRENQFIASVAANPRNARIVSRNCSNNMHSLRVGNKWKFILDRVKRERMLFDLAKDPGEQNNVLDQHPDVSGDLEVYLSNHLKDLDQITDPTPCQL